MRRAVLMVLAGALLLAAGVGLRACVFSAPDGGGPSALAGSDAPEEVAAPTRVRKAPTKSQTKKPAVVEKTAILRIDIIPAEGLSVAWPTQVSFFGDVLRGAMVERGETSVELELPVGSSGDAHVRVPDHAVWIGRVDSMPAAGLTLEAKLVPTFGVAGVVLAQDGETPAPNCLVRTPNNSGRRTTRGGKFRITGLLAGPVRLDVQAPVLLGGPVSLEVEAGAEDVRIVLARLVRLRFRLLDAETGRGIDTTRAALAAFGPEGETLLAEDVIHEGAVAWPRARWPQSLHGGETRRYRVIADGYSPTGVLEVDSRGGETERVLEVRLVRDAATTGILVLHVTAAEGPAPTSVVVTRVAGTRREQSVDVVGGRAEVSLPIGKSQLLVGSGRGADAAYPWLPEKLSVELGAGEQRSERVTLRRGGFLRMRVTDGGVRPQRVMQGTKTLSNRFRKVAGDEPYWLCGPLPASDYRVRASNGRLTKIVSVTAGEVTPVEYGDR